MQIRTSFRMLVARVNLSEPSKWEEPVTENFTVFGSLSVEEREFLCAIFGPVTDESVEIVQRLGRKYLSGSVETILVMALRMFRGENISAIWSLKRALRNGHILTHRVQNMRKVGKKGIEEILEFLGIRDS